MKDQIFGWEHILMEKKTKDFHVLNIRILLEMGWAVCLISSGNMDSYICRRMQ